MAEAAAPTVMRSQKYNIGQYRGVLDTVEHVKAKIDRERNEAATREKGLRVTLADKIAKGSQVQKELSIQLRCAGRSYSQILDANRELGDQMRVEIEQREDVIGELRKEIRDKEKIILVADKPWKEALAKQELKLLPSPLATTKLGLKPVGFPTLVPRPSATSITAPAHTPMSAKPSKKPEVKSLSSPLIQAGLNSSSKEPKPVQNPTPKAVPKPAVVPKLEPSKKDSSFDLKLFHQELSATLRALHSDHNVGAALHRVQAQNVPKKHQAAEFVDIVTRSVEEMRSQARRSSLAFAAGLVADLFDKQECFDGIKIFFEEVYEELCTDIPLLPGIMLAELVPTLYSVLPKEDLHPVLPEELRVA